MTGAVIAPAWTPIHTPPRSGVASSSDRSRDIEVFCSRLGRILCARAADSLLDAGVEQGNLMLVVLPSWSWATPAISVGRKSVARDGGTLRMPVRLSWDTGPVVVSGADVVASWSASGLGRLGEASTTISTQGCVGSMDGSELASLDGPIPSRVHAEPCGSDHVRAELAALSRDGKAALWEMLGDLEHLVRKEVGSAAGRVCADISGSLHSAAMDDVTIEAISSSMMYGAPDSSKPSRVMAMIERALRPDEFARVDPSRWLRMTIRRDAEQEVRHAIGDPHVGRKVRNLARELGVGALADLDSFVRAYAERYPADRIARSRVLDALGADMGPLTRSHSDAEITETHRPGVPFDPVFVAAMERMSAGVSR